MEYHEVCIVAELRKQGEHERAEEFRLKAMRRTRRRIPTWRPWLAPPRTPHPCRSPPGPWREDLDGEPGCEGWVLLAAREGVVVSREERSHERYEHSSDPAGSANEAIECATVMPRRERSWTVNAPMTSAPGCASTSRPARAVCPITHSKGGSRT
jgi:hypothetical protein